MRSSGERPLVIFDPMTQHERTSLAWERTAVAMMVVGVLLARHASSWTPHASLIGIAQVVVGSGLLVWAGRHYDDLHGPLRAGDSPVHPAGALVIGVVTTAFTAAATVISIIVVVR